MPERFCKKNIANLKNTKYRAGIGDIREKVRFEGRDAGEFSCGERDKHEVYKNREVRDEKVKERNGEGQSNTHLQD